jgi:hypothetical protein
MKRTEPTCPDFSPRMRASVLTSPPRPVFTSITPGFIFAMVSSLTRWYVLSMSGQFSEMMSLVSMISSIEVYFTPSSNRWGSCMWLVADVQSLGGVHLGVVSPWGLPPSNYMCIHPPVRSSGRSPAQVWRVPDCSSLFLRAAVPR